MNPLLPLILLVVSPLRAETTLLPPPGREPSREGLIGSVVRSQRWNLRQNPSPVEELEGDVVYKKAGRLLRADWALFDHSSEDISARGNLRGEETFPDGTRVSLAAHQGSHNRKTGLGRVQGRTPDDAVKFSLGAPGGAALGDGQARLLRWDLRRATATAEGDVVFAGDRGQARAEAAAYDHRGRAVTLSGRRPFVTARGDDRSGAHWSAAVQADSIQAWETGPDRVRVVGRGATRGWLHFPKQDRRIPERL